MTHEWLNKYIGEQAGVASLVAAAAEGDPGEQDEPRHTWALYLPLDGDRRQVARVVNVAPRDDHSYLWQTAEQCARANPAQ